MNGLLKKAIAECLGTFVLVLVACGVAALTNGGLVATSLSFGLVIVAMAYSIGRISGCHINPAVSLGTLLAKRITLVEFFVYVGSQIVGGFLGGVLIFGIAKMGNIELAGNACNYVIGREVKALPVIATLLTEIVLTFIFVYVILNATDEKAKFGNLAGIIIGLTLTLVHLIGINLTGTSVNPARSIATAFQDLIFNGNTKALAQVWMFIVAPLAGGALAALIFNVFHKEEAKED